MREVDEAKGQSNGSRAQNGARPVSVGGGEGRGEVLA
jgi:hypothetical protein